MGKFQKWLVKLGAKMMLNEKQEVSFMKLGGTMMAVSEVVIKMPSMGYHVSIDIVNLANLILYFGLAMGISGARDAIKK